MPRSLYRSSLRPFLLESSPSHRPDTSQPFGFVLPDDNFYAISGSLTYLMRAFFVA